MIKYPYNNIVLILVEKILSTIILGEDKNLKSLVKLFK